MSINLFNTNLGGKDLSFRTFQDIYFEIEILAYDEETKSVKLKVLDYEVKNIEPFKNQKPKAPVLFIFFEPFKWEFIERHLSIYTKSKLERDGLIIENKKQNNANESKDFKSRNQNELSSSLKSAFSYSPPPKSFNYKLVNQESFIEKVEETANIYFKDAIFNLGFVSITYTSKRLNQLFNLKIENHFLLAEFNAVKSYFPKVFGGNRKFTITIVFTLTNNVITDIVTNSVEIESINEDIIDSIKRERISKLTTTPIFKTVDKSLFTSDDIFNSFDDNLQDGNVFKQSDEDILKFLIETKNVRNAKHLQYLSGSKHSSKQKLRFTLKPLFGFLFFIEGESKNHFCWELLNSHATYLWSFDKIESHTHFQLKRIEETINIIRERGRETYKSEYKKNNVDNDLSFCTIEHSNINSEFIEGFVEWQHRLKERLV